MKRNIIMVILAMGGMWFSIFLNVSVINHFAYEIVSSITLFIPFLVLFIISFWCIVVKILRKEEIEL